MPSYHVTYTDPEASYPAPKQETLVECSKEEIWDKALELGTVQKIFDMDWGGTVFSIHWTHNHLGLTQAQIDKNLEF